MSNCNFCLDQLLQEDPPEELIVVNNQGSPAIFENGVFPIPEGVEGVTILFGTTKLSSEYTFNSLIVENTQDAAPLTIMATPTAHSQVGFTVVLSGRTDSPNYKLRWEVNVTELS